VWFLCIIQTLLELSNRVALLFSDKVVSYTQDYARHSAILRPFLKKTQAIYPPVPTPFIDVAVRKKLSGVIGIHTLVIGVAARLAAEKGIEYLIEALPMLPKDTVIVIAGPMEPVGEEKYKEKILSLVAHYKEQVVFLGTLSQNEIGAFYSLLHILVLPSVNSTEAFGLVQVEAMLLGIPVVVSNLPGVRVPVQKTGMGIIVKKKDSRALAEVILMFQKNKRIWIKKKEPVEEFSTKKTIQAYEKMFYDL
jgi:glycosyltransferase involved in cell wall biosynthesis